MSEIVCQVLNRETQVELIWSSGGGFFRPYAIAGSKLLELREATKSVRTALGDMVCTLNDSGDGPVPWEPSYALAEAGFRLYNCVLPTEEDTAKKVRRWIDDLRRASSLTSLEIVVEEQSADSRAYLSVPWNLVYDERPAKHKPAFQSGQGAERWRPFWSIRYNLTSGRRVEPLRRLPIWSKPRVIAAINPDIYDEMHEDQKQKLDQFLAETGIARVGSMAELEQAMEEGYPQLFYYLGHATPDYLTLGNQETVTPSDLRNLLRSFDDRERPEGMLAFLNACQTAEAGQAGSFLEVLHSFGFTGAIATEQQTIDNFANELGLAFLRGFLQEGRPLGELLHELRLTMAPLGLLYGAHCPPEIRVRNVAEDALAPQLAIHETGRVAGVRLQAPALKVMARAVAQPPELPAQPYRSLGYFDRADRALFTGRDSDIVRFAATLDRPDTRILILHGESGLGKSSFLRAGVIPYLEEECVGYRFLRRADQTIVMINLAKDPIGQIAQALLDATGRTIEYQTPSGEPIRIELRQAIDDVLGRPADYTSLRAALTQDAGLFQDLLTRLAGRLPHALVLIVDQAEELFTMARTPDEVRDRDHALKMIQRLVDIKSDVKLIVSLRTEYYGRLLDHLRAGRRDFSGVRDDLLRDFSLSSLIAAIERPTLATPIASGQPSPREKYGFRFAEGVAAKIAEDGLNLRTENQDSVLPLIQVICTQLYERKRSEPESDGVITRADLEAIRGVEGGLKAFAEEALERSLGLGPSDRQAFKALFTRLYSRQVDGTLTTWLAPRDALEHAWTGSVPFARVLEAAVSVRLLREDDLRVEGTEPRPFIRLGHDALAKVAAAWQKEREEEDRLEQERAAVALERQKRRRQIRKLVAGICLAAGLAVLFGAIGFWAVQQKFIAQRSQQRAQDSLRIASQGVDDLLTEVADVDLADIPQMEQVRSRLLEKAQDAYQQLLITKQDAQEPVLRWVKGKSHGRLGDIREMMGDFAGAENSYLEGIEQLTALSAQFPENFEYRRDLVRSHLGLGVLYKKSGRFQDAESELSAAVQQGEPLATSSALPDRQLLADLDYQRGALWARQEELHGKLRPPLSDRARQSEQAYRSALSVQEELAKEHRDRPDQRAKLGRYLNNLAKFLTQTDRSDEAEKAFLEAIEQIRPSVAKQLSKLWSEKKFLEAIELVQASSPLSPGERWQLARNEHNLGLLFYKQKKSDLCLKLLDNSKENLEKLSQAFPRVPQYRQELAAVYLNLGRIAPMGTQSARAQADLKRTRDLCKELVDQSQPVPDLRLDLAIADLELASCLGHNLEAPRPAGESSSSAAIEHSDLLAAQESAIREAIEQLNMLGEGESGLPDYANVHLGRAYCQLAKRLILGNKPDEARSAAEQAIHYNQAALELRPENRRYLWEDYVIFSLILLKFPDQTERAAQAALELPRLLPQEPDSYIRAALLLARCAGASKDQAHDYGGEAVQLLKNAVEKGLIHDAKQLDPSRFSILKHRDDFKELQRTLEHARLG
jgi:hypothetical protein